MPNKTKARTIYKLQDGTRVPSVTTVLNLLAKPALIEWAYQQGLKGEDYKAVRDAMGDIGTLAHYLIMCHLTKQTPDLTEWSKVEIDLAENCLLSYYEWERTHPIEPILVEAPLVSERHGYGGTIDCLAKLNGELVLIDFKTSKAIYPEHLYQLAAYQWLITDTSGYATPSTCMILRIGRDENEGFEERVMTNLTWEFELFLSCLKIYELQKLIRKEK